jgi:hypothetical protein
VDGNAYICDTSNNAVRYVDASSQIVSKFAGDGTPAYQGDDGLATQSRISSPSLLRLDVKNNLYICDFSNHRVRVVDGTTNIITTLLGNGLTLNPLEQGPAHLVSIEKPNDIELDGRHNLYVSSDGKSLIRFVDRKSLLSHVIAGMGSPGFGGDNGDASGAVLNRPFGLLMDPYHRLYIGDSNNHRVRRITFESRLDLASRGLLSLAPAVFARWSHLHVVDLANNALANGTQVRLALSNVFFEGSNASVLDVRNNPLEPLDFYNLTSLKQLFVNHTSLLFASYALARLPRLVRVNSWTNGVMNLSSQGIVELPVPLLDSWTTGISTIDLSHNNLSSMRNIA